MEGPAGHRRMASTGPGGGSSPLLRNFLRGPERDPLSLGWVQLATWTPSRGPCSRHGWTVVLTCYQSGRSEWSLPGPLSPERAVVAGGLDRE